MCSVGHTHQLSSLRGVVFTWCDIYGAYILVAPSNVRVLLWFLAPRAVTYKDMLGAARRSLACIFDESRRVFDMR